jgi:benzoyl-CoA reductase/2-hydroxyglutaryl-CoA dehydratase subunit BcrC/BadD/HgdB
VDEAERLGMEAPLNWGLVRFMKSREHQVLRRMRRVNETVKTVKRTQLPLLTRATPRADLGGMPEGRVPLECAPKLKDLMADHYLDLDAAAKDGERHVVWSSGLAPVEILRGLGLTPYFPENHAALIGASRQAGPYIRRSLAAGFSQFASTAMTSDIGAFLAGESPLVPVYDIQGPPPPEALVYNTAYAETLRPWFEFYSQRFGVPVYGLHPSTGVGELDRLDVDIAVQQLSRLVSELEERFDRKLDFDRLAEVVGYSQKAASLWAAIVDLARSTPSPLTYFDMLVHLAPMVLMRGTSAAVEYYRILLAELEQRVAGGTVAVPGERFRFYWEGPPIWCALRPLATLFLEHQVAVVSSNYSHVFAVDGLDPDNPIESMARCYAGIYPNLCSSLKETFLRADMERFGVDAIIYHDGRTARKHSSVRDGLGQRLQAANGLPYIVVEADTHDLRLFSLDALDRKVVEFIEMTERRNGHQAAPDEGMMARNTK